MIHNTLNMKFHPSAAQRQDCTLDRSSILRRTTLLPPTLTNTTLQINFMRLCLNWEREVPGENPHWTDRKAQTGIKQCCGGLCYCLTARQVISPDTTHFCTCKYVHSLSVCGLPTGAPVAPTIKIASTDRQWIQELVLKRLTLSNKGLHVYKILL